LKQIKK